MKKLAVCFLIFFMNVIPAMPLDSAGVVLKESSENKRQKSERDAKREADVKAKAELLGLGTDIKIVTLSSPPIFIHGIIENISADSLRLKAGDQIKQIKYSQIDTLRLAKQKYKAQGQVNPVAVRLIAIDLAKDKEVKLKLVSDKKIKGRILSVDSDSFIIYNSETIQREPVLFSKVVEIQEARMPGWKKGLIGVGIGIGILAIVYLVGASRD